MVEIISHELKVDKTKVNVGEPINFTGTIKLDKPVQNAELVIDVYVNDSLIKNITKKISGITTSYTFQLVFNNQGTYSIRTYAQLHYQGYRVIVNIPGSLNRLAIIDTKKRVYLWFNDVSGDVVKKRFLPIIYTVVGYPNKKICAIVKVYNNGSLVKSEHVCADTESHAEINVDPSILSAGTLTVEAKPDGPNVQGDRSTWNILDLGNISVSNITYSKTNSSTNNVAVIELSYLPKLGGGYWYRICTPDFRVCVDTEGGGRVSLRVETQTGGERIKIDSLEVRLCNKQWYPTICKPLIKTIKLSKPVVIECTPIPSVKVSGSITGIKYHWEHGFPYNVFVLDAVEYMINAEVSNTAINGGVIIDNTTRALNESDEETWKRYDGSRTGCGSAFYINAPCRSCGQQCTAKVTRSLEEKVGMVGVESNAKIILCFNTSDGICHVLDVKTVGELMKK